MAMKKELTATLDARQVRAACEAFVAAKMNDDTLAFAASVADDISVTVEVTKRRVRKPRVSKAAETHESGLRG